MTVPDQIAALIAAAKAGDPYALGVMPSPIDTRDLGFTPSTAAFPGSYMHPAAHHVPVRNQQGGTCVGNSIATCLSLMEYAENSTVVPFDGELLNDRVVAKQYGAGAAAMPRDVLQDILDHGAVAFMGDAGSGLFFPKAYAAVDHTSVDAVKAAISSGPGTVVTAACWLLAGFGDNEATVYQHDVPGETPWGYHELTFVGYDDKGVIFQNSWSPQWGAHGFGRFAWDYVVARIGEMWAITDNPDSAGGKFQALAVSALVNGRAVRKGTSAAVYVLEQGGRIWMQSLAMAQKFGIDMGKVESLPPEATEWNLPVIGPDAPMRYQG